MSRKVNRIDYRLDTKNIKKLPLAEIRAILRGADDLIMSGGRSLLAKILKGSKDKKVLELGLYQSPVYGYFADCSLSDITAKIDWLIKNDYLAIEYDGRLPLLVFTPKGWEIEKETYTDELLEKLSHVAETADYAFVADLKDRNRSMILLLLEKVRLSGNRKLVPVLEAWAKVDYSKVQKVINSVIRELLVVPNSVGDGFNSEESKH